MRIKRVLSLAAGLLLALRVQAALAGDDSGWIARFWLSDEGLPDNTLTGMAQTPDGYIWLATPSGLTLFDGINFHQHSLMELAGQNNRGIRAILLDHKGGLTMAMDRGAVVCLDPGSPHVFVVNVHLPDRVPQNLAEDGAG